MRICMVGSGRMATNHSRALSGLPDVHLHTVVDPDREYAEALKARFGYERAVASLDEALAAGECDAVVVCTPNRLHAPQCAAALRAGMHVLCEIPLALSLEEAEELGRLAEERGLCLMVCHTNRFKAARAELRRRIRSGALHPVRLLGRFHLLRRGQLKTDYARRGWDDNALWHHGCHAVDSVMDILGEHEPQGLHVQFGPVWPSLGIPLDVDLHWIARSPLTGEEVPVAISISHNDPWGSHEYRVIGREETLVEAEEQLLGQAGVLVDEPGADEAVRRQDAAFVAAVRDGRKPAVDVRAALAAIRVLQAAWDVFAQGRAH